MNTYLRISAWWWRVWYNLNDIHAWYEALDSDHYVCVNLAEQNEMSETERISDVVVDNLRDTDRLTGLPIAWSHATILFNFIEF